MMDELNAAVEDLPEVTVLLAEQIDRRPPVPAKVSPSIGEDLAAILYIRLHRLAEGRDAVAP